MIDQTDQINSLDILTKDKLVASIITNDDIECTGSDEMGFYVTIGGAQVVIAAEKIQINIDNK